MSKLPLIRSVIIGVIFGVALFGIWMPQTINADLKNSATAISRTILVKNGHLTICKLDKNSFEVTRTIKMIITAYSSVPEETDDTPFITASGMHVKDGIIANNMLPFGTKLRIPALYGSKIFTVEDRMNQRKGKYQADIWLPSHEKAKEFGAKLTNIEILEN